MFTVCVLLYGDHLELASRCLTSLIQGGKSPLIRDLRIGLNTVGLATHSWLINRFIPQYGAPVHLYQETLGKNVFKYPLMRKMLHDPARPLAEYVMWFDDDSYLKPGQSGWWDRIVDERLKMGIDMLGSVYTLTSWRKGQVEGIQQQPWYADKPIRKRPGFITGGWWVLRSSIVQKWDWPIKELIHNNGDVLLSELCRQQDYLLGHFNTGVAINADSRGRESCAMRRGASSLWPWQEGYVYDPSVHEFKVNTLSFGLSHVDLQRSVG